MRVRIDAASAQAFMATPLKVERNAMPLMLGSALAALDIDPWSLAGELATLSRKRATIRLAAFLGKIREGVPEADTIARQAVAALPPPSVEGADLPTAIRLASRDPELVGTLLGFLAVTALEILLVVSVITGSLLPARAGYCLVALTGVALMPRHGAVSRTLLAIASCIASSIFAIVRFGT